MKQIFLIFKWTMVFAILLALVFFSNQRQAIQKVRLQNIEIKKSDANFINKQIVLEYLEDKSFFFDSVLVSNFSQQRVEEILDIHPAIKKSEVYVSQTGGVNILIEQKKAIVRIKSNTNDYYLDEFGSMMQLFDNYTVKLVVATGEISFDDHIEIYNFISKINTSDFWSKQITQIHFEDDEILLIPRVGDQKILIGSFDNVLERLDNLYQFYKVAMPLKGWQIYSRINLKFNNQIVCVRK